ncbi:MAG: hypothetical protein IJN56_02315 [Clostridia bacterium]|nr:hypothetical protein [Clostridia bacterium]
MRKRLSSKVLAVILTLAICATTVLGCLMTVSAAESCYSFGEAKFPSAEDLSEASIDVTFAHANLPNGIAAGGFTWTEVDADASDYLVLKEVTAKTAGFNVTVEEDYVLFDSENAKNPVVLTLTFEFSNGSADKDKTYKIRLDDVELAYNSDEYYTEPTGLAIGEIAAECQHTLTVTGTPLVTDDVNRYAVYENAVCSKCGETFGYQLVPTSDKLSEETVSEGTIDLLEFGSYLTDAGSTSTYYDTNVADNGEAGTEDDPIIIDSAEEFVYLCKGDSTGYTAGKYFKVADGIKGFDLSKNGDLDYDGTLADNIDKVKASGGKNHAGGTSVPFQGTFDGNGVTVYGAWTNHESISGYVGLFSCTKGDVTIKNVNVKLASFTGTTAVGGIVGYHSGDGTNTLTIENCSVTESNLELTGTGYGRGVAGIVGYSANLSSWKEADKQVDGNGDGDMVDTIYVNGKCIVNNCFVNIDPTYFIGATDPDVLTDTSVRGTFGGLVGFMTSNGLAVDKCISIGVTPYAVQVYTGGNDVQHSGLESHFTNTYTDQLSGSAVSIGGSSLGARNFTGRVTQLDVADMQGSAGVVNMPALDWGTTWVMDGTDTYPRLALPGETFDTIYWDGANTKTAPTVGSGTKTDPYIISTVAELAYISGQTRDNYAITDSKYYKIADGIKSIVMQPYAYGNDIKALDSAAATKAYFEANASNMKQWLYYGWEGSTFCGKIDFNGATVYGIYQVSSSNAGLFSNIDAGAEFHNLAIKNSYMVSQSSGANYQCGALAAVTNGGTYGKSVNGFIWAKNIEIANNYLYGNSTSHDRNGIMFGASSDIMYVDNALVYGNDATYGDGVPMPLYSSANNSVLVSSAPAIPEGLVVVDDGAETDPRYYNMVRNSIFLGFNPFDLPQGYGSRFNDLKGYQNCYTDANVETDTDKNGKTLLQYFYVTTTTPYITRINAADALGTGAQTAMPNLTWGTDWYCGAMGKYPVLAPFATFGTSKYSNPDLTLVGTNVGYNEDGSFDFNLHYVPETAGFAPTLYVGTTDKSKFIKLDTATESCYTSTLGANAIMYTIPNLSARDIDLVWLPTLVTAESTILEWGKSQQIAIADNAKAILEGNYDIADKNVAAALLNYGEKADAVSNEAYNAGTIDLLEFGDYLINDLGSTSKWYDTKLADNGETGADWDNAIIIDSAEELVYLAKASGNDTDGKYYKVADNIAGFNLATNALDVDGTLADNIDIIKGSGKNHAGGTPGFQGYFDGNGATVYGAWTNHTSISAYAGLFTCTQGDVTIKNINVNKAHFTATTAAGGIVGYYKGEGTNTNNTTLTIENCSVTDSYLEVTKTGYGYGVGAVLGRVDCPSSYVDANDEDGDGNTTETLYVNNKVIVKNCYVNLDEDNFVSVNEGTSVAGQQVSHGGVVGHMGSNALDVNHCIVIGIKPYATSISTDNNAVQHSGLESHFTNVYTTSDVPVTGVYLGGTLTNRNFTGKVFPLTEEQLTGLNAKDNMTALDWNNVWTTTSTYPTFINKDYKAPASGIVATWDGTVATGFASGTGTKEDPYIISTGAEFAYMVKEKMVDQAATISPDKYFKVADGISAFVMQKPEYASEIMALSSAADTKAYFEENAANMLKWPNYGWEGSSFCGHFDGNGATVYGLYQTSTNNAGLFSTVDAGAVIQNIGVKNSYLTSSATNYQVAAIAPVANSSSYGAKQEGIVWVNGCTVANNYMYNACTSWERSGVIAGGFSNDIIMIDNCLVYGNDATYGDGVKMALTGVGNNDVETTAKKPAELPSFVENGGFYCNTVRNSIILDCDALNTKGGRSYRRNAQNCVSGVYTNGVSGTVTFSNGEWTYEDAQIKAITTNDVIGSNATSIVNALNAAPIGETVWYVGAAGDMPGFKEAGSMPLSAQTLYNGIILDTPDTVGAGTVYNANGSMVFGMYGSSLNIKANPYMIFTFAFSGEYKENRENIKIRFTYTKDGESVTSEEIAVPAFTGENVENVNGWTHIEKDENGKTAGRYHTYRATNLPVEALASGIKVEASYNGGAWADFGSYSVEGFALMADNANKIEPCGQYASYYEVSKALLFYVQMIQARYGK